MEAQYAEALENAMQQEAEELLRVKEKLAEVRDNCIDFDIEIFIVLTYHCHSGHARSNRAAE